MVINSAKVRNSFQGGQKTNRFIIGRRGRVGDESIVTETLILEVSLITFLYVRIRCNFFLINF